MQHSDKFQTTPEPLTDISPIFKMAMEVYKTNRIVGGSENPIPYRHHSTFVPIPNDIPKLPRMRQDRRHTASQQLPDKFAQHRGDVPRLHRITSRKQYRRKETPNKLPRKSMATFIPNLKSPRTNSIPDPDKQSDAGQIPPQDFVWETSRQLIHIRETSRKPTG